MTKVFTNHSSSFQLFPSYNDASVYKGSLQQMERDDTLQREPDMNH